MKNKFKNYCIVFKIVIFLLSFFLQSCTSLVKNHKLENQVYCHAPQTLSLEQHFSGDEDNIFSSGERRNQQQFLKGFGKGAKETFNDLLDLPEHIVCAAKNIPKKTWDILSNPTESCDSLVDALRTLPELPTKIANHLLEKYEEYKNLSEEEQSFANGKFVFEALKFYVSNKYINLLPTKENLQALGFAAGNLKEGSRGWLYFGKHKVCRERFHRDIKKEIIDNAGSFQHIVGRNPNVEIVKNKIVLSGTEKKFLGKSFKTDLNASDFFGDS